MTPIITHIKALVPWGGTAFIDADLEGEPASWLGDETVDLLARRGFHQITAVRFIGPYNSTIETGVVWLDHPRGQWVFADRQQVRDAETLLTAAEPIEAQIGDLRQVSNGAAGFMEQAATHLDTRARCVMRGCDYFREWMVNRNSSDWIRYMEAGRGHKH